MNGTCGITDREVDKDYISNHPWEVASPVAEEPYTAADAIAVGSMILTLLRHADRVRMACIAQVVNVACPVDDRNRGPYLEANDLVPIGACFPLRSR